MNKQDVIAFFDAHAAQWDAEMIRSDSIIHTILTNAGVTAGVDVLDVACGTGVLFPDYLLRGVRSVTAIDISPEMARIAREKFPQVNVVCGDVETASFDRKFDCIIVYNAFPHFPDPENLIRVLAGLLKPGGMLTVAHGMSRAAIDRHHEGHASKISAGLMHEDELAAIFARYLTVTTKISNDRMYQVAGQL
jgi:demethylmenaquinone methyltransferase/2-methoxy-6-polyprenyl-1,4-benzoquinol methylase